MAPINPSHHLIARAPAPPVPCAGCLDPSKVNNKVYFSLFALIFAAIVVASIWFFFHAKHGGFHWQQGDFDDWKSTVLRKKDANGNTIYSARSVVSRPRKSDRIAAKSVVGYDEKGRKGVMAVRGFGGSHSVYYSDGFTQYSGDRSDAMTSISRNEKKAPRIRGGYTQAPTTTDHSRRYCDRDLRDYKHEKPARVGGMNRSADGTTYDYTDRSDTATEMTETSSHAPILSSHDRKRQKAEKRAAEDAARMERKWRKEAEAAAAALARESAAPSTPKKSSPPQKAQTPKSAKRGASRSRSSSPKKQAPRQRDYSFSGAPDESSTVYTGTYTTTSGTRTNSSYYDAYRPLAATSPAQPSPDRREQRRERRPSSSSPSKQHRSSRYTYAENDVTGSAGPSGGRYERVRGGDKKSKGRDVMAGYRRGMDSLGSDSD
ncbi:unnamed protein product [Aureobasidium uvarum]|uniref:Uncharacterized protein n=1 Tax=Aureobasidium uvarum TaxID=2773716 RepID=A0A9N8PV87_9PEZI|nr:unnamed protein product [Aureobasidium uvarum]